MLWLVTSPDLKYQAKKLAEPPGLRDGYRAPLGFGTETFESGTKLDSLRFVVGARSGF